MAPGIHWRKKRKKMILSVIKFLPVVNSKIWGLSLDAPKKRILGGVYMRKLAPAWVSYRDDFLISDSVYMMTESFHISLFEGTLHVDKNTRVIQNRKHYAWASRSSLPADQIHTEKCGRFVARFRTGVKFSPRYSNRGDSRRYDILWWYHVTNVELWEGIGVNSLRRKSRSCVIVSHLMRDTNSVQRTRHLFLTMSKPPGSFWNFIIEQNWLIIVK